MKVSELMTRQVATVRAGDSASTAARLMWDGDCGALPVLDDDGRPRAMVTDRDLSMTAMFQDRPMSAILVSEAMSKSLASCGPDDNVIDAERTMRRNQLRRLPVMDSEGRLVGILALADIVRATGRDNGKPSGRGSRRSETIPDEVAATLADICSPRQPSAAQDGKARAGNAR